MRRYVQELQPDQHRRPLRARRALPPRPDAAHPALHRRASTAEIEITVPAPGPRRDPRRDLRRHRLPGPGAAHRRRSSAATRSAQADIMRKAMGKKIADDHARPKRRSSSPAPSRRATRRSDAEAIFDLIEPFAGYAFNKAHCCVLRHHRLPDRVAQGELPRRVHDRRAPDDEERSGTHERIAQAVAECIEARHRRAAARRQRERRQLQRRTPPGRLARHPLRPRRGQERRRERRRGHHRRRARRTASTATSRTSASAPTSRGQQPRARTPRQGRRARHRSARPRHARHQRRPPHGPRPARAASSSETGQATMFDLFGSQVDTPLPGPRARRRARPPRGHARLGEGAARRLRLRAPVPRRRRRPRPLHHPLVSRHHARDGRRRSP